MDTNRQYLLVLMIHSLLKMMVQHPVISAFTHLRQEIRGQGQPELQ